jgi:predicted phosphodiesterase
MKHLLLSALLLMTGSSLPDPSHPIIVRGPVLGCVTMHSIAIRWTTDLPSRGTVEYGNAGFDRSVQDTALATVHTVTLDGLSPATAYTYRVIAAGDTSRPYTFWTAVAPGEPFVFGAYGDTRRGGPVEDSAHVRILRQMLAHKVRFAIHSGDLVSKNTVENWDDYFEVTTRTTPFWCSVPIFSVAGNHDKGQMYYDNVILPVNPSGTSSYYSFDYGSVHFTAINNYEEYENPDSPQRQWLAADLASPAAQHARFRIAFLHSPPYTSPSGHTSDLKIRAALSPLLEKHQVDIVFAGHNHFYERSIPINGTVYIVAGAGGAPLYDFKSKESFSAFQEKSYNFCKGSIVGDTLRLWMITAAGVARDSLMLISRTPAR